jgi:presenilin 1
VFIIELSSPMPDEPKSAKPAHEPVPLPNQVPTETNVTTAQPRRSRPNTEQPAPAVATETAPATTTTDTTPAEMRYYVTQISLIVRPVIACILLSVTWVKISLNESDFRPARSSLSTVYQEQATDSSSDIFLGSLTNALIILAQIVIATVVFVVLFKYGCWRILYGYLFLVVVLLLALMGFVLLLNLLQVFSIPLDYITMVFALYNFSVTGLMAVFWRGPLWLQQSYLVVMSSLMAFSLTGLEAWTTWLLLAILALWGKFKILLIMLIS